MSYVVPSAPPAHDNLALQIEEDLLLDFNVYNQSIYNDTDSAKMAFHHPEYYNPFYHEDSIVPGSPFSEKSFQRTFSIRSKQSAGSHYTRQINMSIGEEWENIHQAYDTPRRSVTCPPTPKRQFVFTQPLSPWSEKQEQSAQEQVADEPLRYFFNRLSEEGRVAPKDYVIQPNPHNSCNHKIHSVLHCPCFFFFCLLCCLPGVHFMERSDEEYRSGHDDRAKHDGRWSTVLYTLGVIAAVVFLSGLIYFSVSFVHGDVS
ncbi:unnamed protein product [Mytilus coruscus]|uniref:Uncharacterized protein n=1 Tax=Mytilus coruscus TaxID=42192 RepID=A0A6J8DU56_MYTCO|nr:unnamed protein product [Mytilus coruscus]